MAFIESPKHLRLIAIATKEVHHGKGFGLELLVALMRIAKERGKERITLRTKIPRWWTKRGAVAVGKHDNGETEMEICL
jgi:GNAT superfamily N-acetyltransferase